MTEWAAEDHAIWSPEAVLDAPVPPSSDVGHSEPVPDRPYAGSLEGLLPDNAFDVDPTLIPDDFHNINLEDAVRLTPATLAFHISQGLWQPAEHLLYLASEIAKELLEGNAHLIVSMPPRHGKSELLSIWTSLWWLDLFPEDLILLATYGADLSQGFSRRVRDMLIELGGIDNKQSPEFKLAGRPRLRTHVRSDMAQAGHFLTPQGGGMTAVGLGGSITGRGANLLFIDDYVKNAEDAASPSNQQKVFEWFTSTAYTRLEPGGSVIILATRWEAKDLIGRLKANAHEFSGKWRIIELPALANSDGKDPLGRAPGQPLWPERYPLARLLQIKSMLGAYFWASLYQQRPIKRSDVKFEDELLVEVTEIPPFSSMRMLRSWDLAGTEKGGDWTVGTLLGQDGPAKRTSTETIICDVVRGQWAQAELENMILATAEEDGPDIPIFIEQEPGSSGKNYANYLANTVLRDYKVKVKPPTSDKWLKAQPFYAAVSRGRVKMLKAAWNKVLRQEFNDFPAPNTHDDIVDSVSQGYNELTGSGSLSAVWGRVVSKSKQAIRTAAKKVTGAVFGRKRNT